MWYVLFSALVAALISPRILSEVMASGTHYSHSGTTSPMGAGADSCRTCHEAGSFVFNTTTDQNCYGCHHDMQVKTQKAYKHNEVINQQFPSLSCEGCHRLHEAGSEPLLAQDELALCQSCHPEQREGSSHPVVGTNGGRLITGSDGRPLTCASHCHDVHGADYQYFSPKEPGRELCITCHKDFVN
jgi:predicted CXXCH cytochrome family protein